MAQRRMRGRMRYLLARYGLRPVGAGTGALVVVAIAAAVWGFATRVTVPTELVERADAGEAAAQAPAEPSQEQVDGTGGEAEPPARYVVHVDGAVAAPGVVCIEGQDVRVFDAVEEAGGLLDDADTSSVNLAERLVDGAKIHIPHEGDEEPVEAPVAAGQAQTSGATGIGEAVSLININTASESELQALPGIGEVMARTICDDRTKNGPFASCEDLMRVSGIGEKKFERVRGLICV
jgi:competence protein ComEA